MPSIRLQPGETVPDFTLEDENGDAVTPRDIQGKRTLLFFYAEDDAPACTDEALEFAELMPEFKRRKIQLMGVSSDGRESHRLFRMRHALPYPLLVDFQNTVAKRFGAHGEKRSEGRTVTGHIRSSFLIGVDGALERVWYGVRPQGHAASVLSALGATDKPRRS